MRRISILGLVALMAVAPFASASSSAPGVTKKTIKIGYHAPMTGAVPLPSASIQRAADLYWKWLKEKGTRINGRDVEVVLRNDNTNPSQAVEVCKEMVEDEKVFMLVGILQAGTVDQVQACARYAASVGVPYVSLGGTKAHLRLDEYFAISMTHVEQANLLGDMFVADLKAKTRQERPCPTRRA